MKEIFDKIKRKKEQEIRNYQKILSVEYEQIYYFRPKEYYTQPIKENYTISTIELNSINNLLGDGWKFNETLSPQNYVILGFLGDCSVGKTHLMNRIIGTNVPELPTQNISFINPITPSNICVIDTPGLRHPYHTFKPNYSIRGEAKKIDYIIKSITIHMSTILFYVTDKMTTSVQKELDVIKKMFLDAPHSESRNLFIIINKPNITTKKEYEDYMSSYIISKQNANFIKPIDILTKEYIHPDATDQDSIYSEDKANRSVLYLLYCPYLLQNCSTSKENPITRIMSFIKTSQQNKVKSLSDTLKPIFAKIAEGVFDLEEKAVKISSDLISLDKSKKRERMKNSQKSEKVKKVSDELNCIKDSIKANELYYWKYFQNITPTFSYYVNEDNRFILEIECAELSNLIIKNPTKSNGFYNFNIAGTKNVLQEGISYDHKNWSNRHYGEIALAIQVPIDIGQIKKKLGVTYTKGIVFIEYDFVPPTNDSDSD